jgi:CRP-like cAMP-binding protein
MDRAALLAEWPLLGSIAPADADELLARARSRRFARGEAVFHEHDPADTLHLIRKGRFAIQLNLFGERAILTILGPGDSFGELALIDDNAHRSATVVALEPGQTLSIHVHDFDRMRERKPELERMVSALLASQVRRLSAQLAEALYLPVDVRIRRRLHAVLSQYGGTAEAAAVPLTQQTLAELAGTTRQAVNKVLREDEAKGIVELRRGAVVVHDPEALARRAKLTS